MNDWMVIRAESFVTQRPEFAEERIIEEFQAAGRDPRDIRRALVEWLRGTGTVEDERKAREALNDVYEKAAAAGRRAAWRGACIAGVAAFAAVALVLGLLLWVTQ